MSGSAATKSPAKCMQGFCILVSTRDDQFILMRNHLIIGGVIAGVFGKTALMITLCHPPTWLYFSIIIRMLQTIQYVSILNC
jgi:hypothetical protein